MIGNEPFVIEGELVLLCQEGGFATDAFVIDNADLDDLVALHFGKMEHVPPEGNRPIGRVRITIEWMSA